MISPQIPSNEQERITALRSLHILDTPPDSLYDRIVQTAQSVFDVPIVLISLVDTQRQWFKSKVGLATDETQREVSFCAHAICETVVDDLESRLFEVQDATTDPRFANNPLVRGNPWIRYYLGFVLQSSDHQNLGTFCLIDTKTRNFSNKEINIFSNLGYIVQELLNRKTGVTDSSDQQIGIHKDGVFLSYDNFYKQINEIKAKINKIGINFNQWRILNIIANIQGATPAIIGRQLDLSNPLVSNYLQKLEAKQLVTRNERDGHDRRLTKLSCTAKGLTYWSKGKDICSELLDADPIKNESSMKMD